jgi:DNA-directed RNA polymerase specialized sigma24 family protein
MDQKAMEAPAGGKRQQKYLRFELQPGDMELLDHLPAPQREALLCSGNYQERADKLGIPLGTLRSRLHRARAALEALRNERPAGESSPQVN